MLIMQVQRGHWRMLELSNRIGNRRSLAEGVHSVFDCKFIFLAQLFCHYDNDLSPMHNTVCNFRASNVLKKLLDWPSWKNLSRKIPSLKYICVALHSSLCGVQTKSLSMQPQDVLCSPGLVKPWLPEHSVLASEGSLATVPAVVYHT